MSPKGPETILFLHPAADRYGVDVALTTLVRGLDRARWRAVVALPGPGPLCAELEAAGATIAYGPLGLLDRRTLRSPWRLLRFLGHVPRAVAFVRRLVREHRPALIHTNSSVVLGGALGARLSGSRHLWHLHDIIDHPVWVTRGFAKLAARLADVVVSNSHATRRVYDVHSSVLAARHRVVHNGVDVGRLAPERFERAEARAALGVPDEAPLVALVGRLNSWKGHRVLIDAAERLRFRHPDAQFLLVGDPPPGHGRLVQELLDEIERRNLSGYVRHLPHDDTIARVYTAADVVVVPSLRPEPFGLVAAEAMACGRPVVGSAHGGLVEVVEGGVTGLLTEPGDVERLAWALQVLIEDRSRAREMGRRGLLRQLDHFGGERMVRDMDRIWSQLLARAFTLPVDEAVLVHVVEGEAPGPDAGPLGRAVHGLAAAQVARGLAVSVVTLGAATEPRSDAGYACEGLPTAGGRGGLSPELRARLVALPPAAIVHLHGPVTATFAAIARALARRGIPYVVTPHGAYRRSELAGLGTLARRRHTRRAAQVLRGARTVHGESDREVAELGELVNLGNVAVVPRGQAPIPAPRTVAGADLRRPLFVCRMGSGADDAGVRTLLDAFAHNAAAEHEGTLWVLGEGPARAALEAHATELGIARRTVFVAAPTRPEQLARIAAADVFVHTSEAAGLAPSVLDALALGRPVIVTEGTDLDDDVREFGAGFVVRRAAADPLGAAMAACERELGDRTLEARRAAALGLVRQRLAWDVVEAGVQRTVYGLDEAQGSARAQSTAQGRARRTA